MYKVQIMIYEAFFLKLDAMPVNCNMKITLPQKIPCLVCFFHQSVLFDLSNFEPPTFEPCLCRSLPPLETTVHCVVVVFINWHVLFVLVILLSINVHVILNSTWHCFYTLFIIMKSAAATARADIFPYIKFGVTTMPLHTMHNSWTHI